MIPDTNAVAGKMLCLNLRAIIAAPIVLLIISCGYEWTHQDCVNCEYEWTYRDCERWKNASVSDIRSELERGADVNAMLGSHYGYWFTESTPLHLAVKCSSNPDIADLLLSHGADVNAQIEFGETPLHKAASNPNPDVTRLLLANGAAVNAIDFHRYTPLHRSMSPDEHHWSIKRGDSYPPSIEVIAELLRSGADPNARNRWNSTALHAAVINRNSPRKNDIIELLLDYGADPGAVDNAGRTPCRYTRDANVSEQITKRLCR